jgi:Predicted transcriptional regulator
VLEVVRALDHMPEETCCFMEVGRCRHQERCGMFPLMQEAREAFLGVLGRETLQTLAERMGFPGAPAPDPAAPARGSP